MLDTSDTIAAIASAREGALRGIIRVSGPSAMECLARMFRTVDGEDVLTLRQPRVIHGEIEVNPLLGLVPCDAYVWPTQSSYTRQPCCEIHSFGSPPILDAMLAAVCQSGVRLAQPGEFTLRAFLAGRLDLTQAEAVLGVIDSRGARDLDVALQQLAGGLARPLHGLREKLLDLLAQLEAGLDFVEEDIEFITAAELMRLLDEIHDAIASLLDQVSGRARTLGQPTVVLVGCPNVGKSSLFNALTQSASSIVSGQAGTTRDYVSRCIDLDGREIELIDTAGLDMSRTQTGVDIAAQDASVRQFEQATIQLLCLDSTRAMNAWEQAELSRTPQAVRLVVLTKWDAGRQGEFRESFSPTAIPTSSVSGEGMEWLRRSIMESVDSATQGDGNIVAATAARAETSLRFAQQCLCRARELHQRSRGDEYIAAELRTALEELGVIVGAVYTDDILDRIFSRFCIGK